MERGILERENIPKFIQQISEVFDAVHYHPQAVLAAVTEAQSVQPSSVAKSEEGGGKIASVSVDRTASCINSSPPRCLSPSDLQKEPKTEVKEQLVILVHDMLINRLHRCDMFFNFFGE